MITVTLECAECGGTLVYNFSQFGSSLILKIEKCVSCSEQQTDEFEIELNEIKSKIKGLINDLSN
jgi:hypothetical protein